MRNVSKVEGVIAPRTKLKVVIYNYPIRILLKINNAGHQMFFGSRFLCRISEGIGLNIRNPVLGSYIINVVIEIS